MLQSLRRHLITAFVLAHAAIITTQALPLPGKVLTDASVDRPEMSRDLKLWAAPLVRAGVVDEGDEARTLQGWNNAVARARANLLRPLWRYAHVTGTHQSWRMFPTVRARGARLHVHLQREPGGAWEPLFVEHSAHRWQARLLNQERTRALRSTFSKRNGLHRDRYRRFVSWLSDRAAEDFPGAHQLRVRYQKVEILPPAKLRAAGELPVGELYWEELRSLEERRP